MTETNSKTVVTLCGSHISDPGLIFVFQGKTSLCETCRLSGVCLKNLETGRLYEIVERRDVKHSCSVHEDGVVTVSVKEAQIPIATGSRVAVEGASFTYHTRNCPNRGCRHWGRLCDQDFLFEGDRLQIVNVKEKIECVRGDELSSCLCVRLH
jgi:uncharacterized protein (UPF0179 family)